MNELREGAPAVNDRLDERTQAWLDTLTYEERQRAEDLLRQPPQMAIARSDRDIRKEMRNGFRTLEDQLRGLRPKSPSKAAIGMAGIVGGAIAQGAIAVWQSLR